MHDPRIDQLARQLVRYSTATRRGENVLIELFDVPEEMGIALIREIRAVKATPFINIHNAKISREMGRGATEEQYAAIAKKRDAPDEKHGLLHCDSGQPQCERAL